MHRESEQDLAQLRKLRKRKFTRTRVPSTDALVALLPNSGPVSSEIQMRKDSASDMRLYPVADGYEIKWPYDGSSFNHELFHVEAGGWDHEHCTVCNASISAKKVCWITQRGSFVILCGGCYRRLSRLQQSKRRPEGRRFS